MTCRFVHRAAAVQALPFTLLAAVFGCSSSSSSRVTLTVTAPSDGQVLTMAEDDTDPQQRGLQFDVEGTARGISRGTTIKLFIDGDEQEVSGRVGEGGAILLPGVTLPPGNHRIHLETSTGSTRSNESHEYTLQALVIASPNDGATITAEDDEDDDTAGVQISVRVNAFAIERTEDITLLLDGDVVERKTAGADGEVEYSGITLSNGRHVFKAVAGEGDDAIESGEVTVHVRQSCASVSFLEPAEPPAGQNSISLGGASCPEPMSGDPFAIRVAISTDAGNGRPVTLFVNGQAVASTTVNGTVASFDDVVLNRFNSSNELRVEVENSEGTHCVEEFPGDIFIDCAGSDCAIVSPTPVSHTENGMLSLYLNAGMRNGDGFDVTVESGPELDGRQVQLIVDGRTRTPITRTAEASGDVSRARFREVMLSEGLHTVEALCTDAAGNVTSSGELFWNVDVTACGVAVTDPAEDTLFLPTDDEDSASDGTQLVVTSTVTGNDCVRQRSAVCDIGAGISGTSFVPFDGTSPLLTIVTLTESGDHALCVEVEDRAGNVGLGAVGVLYRHTTPIVAIESPANNTRFNAAGGTGYTADADPVNSPTACDADFSVLCTELGGEVQLRHDSATGPVFATATCEERASGDPAIPAGYNGRAKVRALFGDGDESATIVATQSIAGTNSQLVGNSLPIVLEGDCRRPAATFSGNPCNTPTQQLSLANAASRSFGVFDSTMDIDQITVTLSRAGGASSMPAPASVTASTATFSGVDFAFDGEGVITVTAVVTDNFGNTGQAMCIVELLDDVPDIVAVSAPTDGAVYGDGGNCGTGNAGEHGVRLTATIDRVADREASVLVNGTVALTSVAIGAGSGGTGAIDVCVPVPDNLTNGGASTVTLRVDSTISAGFDLASRTVHVVTAGPVGGIVIDALAAPGATDPAHRTGVTATWSQPQESWPGQLVDYELRCASAALDLSGLDPADVPAATEAWWSGAEVIDLPDSLTPDVQDPSVHLPFRPEEPRHCVVRSVDVAGGRSPIETSTDLTLRLRQVVIAAGAATTTQRFGLQVAALGDVDGDGIDDLIVGARGRAELIFGSTDPANAARVAFTGPGGGAGRVVAGIGDFNGDGRNDFAIGDPFWNGNAGRVSVFFGRPRADWPSTAQDIETTCNADLCLEGTGTNSIGRALSAVGDFNADGAPDFAIGAPAYPAVSAPPYPGQILIVLGGCALSGTCGLTLGSTFLRVAASMPSGDWVSAPPGSPPDRLSGFQLAGSGALADSQLGYAIDGLGAFDDAVGHDVVISANAINEVHYLSGRAHSGTAGFDVLTVGHLGVPGTAAGTPIATGSNGFGTTLAAIGNFYDAGNGDIPDIAVGHSATDDLYIEPGDGTPAFTAARVRVYGPGSNVGTSIASAFKPFAESDVYGDLDNDGRPELCLGTRTSSPRDITIFYPDVFAESAASDPVLRSSGVSIALTHAAAGSAENVVQYVGDFNDDGYQDIAVGDPRVSSNRGQLILLY
jgi:hypothetical protein